MTTSNGPHHRPLVPAWTLWTLAGTALLALALSAAFAARRGRSDTQSRRDAERRIDDTRRRYLGMLGQAEILLKDGAADEARDAYRKAAAALTRDIPGQPDLADLLQRAQEGHDAAIDQLADQLMRLRERLLRPPSSPATQPLVRAPATVPAVTPSPPPPPVVVAVGKAPRQPQPPPPALVIGDDEIGTAIAKAVEYLTVRLDKGRLDVEPDGEAVNLRWGMEALATYALLQANQAIKDPRLSPNSPFMQRLFANLREMPRDQSMTYTRALRILALTMVNRQDDKPYIKADVEWLLRAQKEGAFTYGMRPAGGIFDNSNSQYGLLGVWAGAEAGIEVPDAFWKAVEKHWSQYQLVDGQWGYSRGPMRAGHAMNCAGVASLLVTNDYLDGFHAARDLGKAPYPPALAKGLAWLENGDNAIDLDAGGAMWFSGYNLYGLERVGLASGFKYFGAHDWYRELSRKVVDEQNGDGSWSARAGFAGTDPVIQSAYCLLFLSRGRHPVMMNKLRFEGAWSNRPRDAANLARYASYQLERPINFQVVSLDRGWTDWTDSPILYLASHKAVELADTEIDKIRSFVRAGGMLFTHADGSSGAFNTFAESLAGRLFPAYPLRDLPATHPIYGVLFPVRDGPRLQYVTNGSRVLMLHSPTDIALDWHRRLDKTRAAVFQTGLNIFLYAAGKTELRNRLSSPVVRPPATPPLHTARVARLGYDGNWDPEPAAWRRVSNLLQLATGWRIDQRPTPIADLRPDTAPLAHLTGTAALELTPAQCEAIRKYVDSGGVLLIDACGGSEMFDRSMMDDLVKIFGPDALGPMPADHPVLRGKDPGMDDPGPVRLRPYAVTKNVGSGSLRYLAGGKGCVIISYLDLSSTLLGTNTWDIVGYQSKWAESFVKNMVIWSQDRDK